MLTVIQYYIIIKIKKTKTSRKDLKKGKNMLNQKKDFNMITKKLETELPLFHYDGLEISEITVKMSLMKLHINVLFIKGNEQITKVLYKDYETGLWYYIKNDGRIMSHKDTFNHTIKNLIDDIIYDSHIEIKEAEETKATEKDVIEVKQELNARFGKEQYFDTDSLQPNKTIIAKIEDINYCESVHKQMKAINNPNWHTVRLATVNSSDFFRINEKLKSYISAYRELKQTISYLRKCKTIDTYDTCFIRYIKRINVNYANGKISNAMFNFIKVKLSMQNVESGVWSSDCEDATGYCKSRRYNKSRLRR